MEEIRAEYEANAAAIERLKKRNGESAWAAVKLDGNRVTEFVDGMPAELSPYYSDIKGVMFECAKHITAGPVWDYVSRIDKYGAR